MHSKKTAARLARILEQVTSDKGLHARWLNTLSYLEYVGARKIIKAIPSGRINRAFLEHISEEARHSLFFKRLSQKISGKDLGFHPFEILASAAVRGYFQKIDRKAEEFSRSAPHLNYLYTTIAVEKRALSVYSFYNKILSQKNIPFSLKGILNEEERHLSFVQEAIKKEDPLWESHLEDLMDFEHQQYFSLLLAIGEDLAPGAARAIAPPPAPPSKKARRHAAPKPDFPGMRESEAVQPAPLWPP